MEAAGDPRWPQAIKEHGRMISNHDQRLANLTEQVARLSQATPFAAAATTRLPPTPAPEKYDGDPARCRGFLLQCSLFF